MNAMMNIKSIKEPPFEYIYKRPKADIAESGNESTTMGNRW